MMFEPKRIHPVGMILSFARMIKSYIIPAIVFFFVGSNDRFDLYFIIGGCCLALLIVVTSILEWWKFTYWFEDGELRIKHGIFVTKKRYIPIERIQTINISAGIVQQLFRLVKVQVETAGTGIEAEAVLSAIKKQDADKIQEVLAEYKQEIKKPSLIEEDQTIPQEQTVYKMKTKDLLVAASTSSGIGVIISAVAAFVSQFDELISFEEIFERFEFLTHASFTLYAILVFIGFFIAWILSIIGVLLKYAYFTVVKVEDEIRISRGIFEKSQVSIPLKRIQAIKIVQNPLRQLLGYKTVYIESAGGSAVDEGTSTILFPVVSKHEVSTLMEQFVPLFKQNSRLHRLPIRSKKRYMIRKVLPAIAIILPLIYFFQPWGYSSLILIPICLVWGYYSYKDAGWNIEGDQLQLAFRRVSKTDILVYRNRLQSVKTKTSYFQKKYSLQTFECTIKTGLVGNSFPVKDMDERDTDKIISWYSYETGK